MRYGYARRFLGDDDLNLQIEALKQANIDRRLIDDGTSHGAAWRRELNDSLRVLKPGDTLIVHRLAVLARSITELIEIVSGLIERGIQVVSPSASLDTSKVFKALAAIERDQKAERTHRGLEAARVQGVRRGPKRKLSPQQIEQARQLIEEGASCTDMAETLKISRTTLYRHLMS